METLVAKYFEDYNFQRVEPHKKYWMLCYVYFVNSTDAYVAMTALNGQPISGWKVNLCIRLFTPDEAPLGTPANPSEDVRTSQNQKRKRDNHETRTPEVKHRSPVGTLPSPVQRDPSWRQMEHTRVFVMTQIWAANKSPSWPEPHQNRP